MKLIDCFGASLRTRISLLIQATGGATSIEYAIIAAGIAGALFVVIQSLTWPVLRPFYMLLLYLYNP
jgi:Flp pilus assembly pilin Flp